MGRGLQNLNLGRESREMNRVGKFGLSFFMIFVANVGCESDDYLAPRREPLKFEPLEIAINEAKVSEGHDTYNVDFRGFGQRYLDVSMAVDCPKPCRLKMAVWTPGSYLVREYA